MQRNTHPQAEVGNRLLHAAVATAPLENCEKTQTVTHLEECRRNQKQVPLCHLHTC